VCQSKKADRRRLVLTKAFGVSKKKRRREIAITSGD
jgi:hypothetical protein